MTHFSTYYGLQKPIIDGQQPKNLDELNYKTSMFALQREFSILQKEYAEEPGLYGKEGLEQYREYFTNKFSDLNDSFKKLVVYQKPSRSDIDKDIFEYYMGNGLSQRLQLYFNDIHSDIGIVDELHLQFTNEITYSAEDIARAAQRGRGVHERQQQWQRANPRSQVEYGVSGTPGGYPNLREVKQSASSSAYALPTVEELIEMVAGYGKTRHISCAKDYKGPSYTELTQKLFENILKAQFNEIAHTMQGIDLNYGDSVVFFIQELRPTRDGGPQNLVDLPTEIDITDQGRRAVPSDEEPVSPSMPALEDIPGSEKQ